MIHTNLLQRSDECFELTKFNIAKLLFIAQMFLNFMQNYCSIYSVLITKNRSCFDDEKELIKFIQSQLFEEILTKEFLGFDLEILSLNLISNSVLALRQYGVISSKNNQTKNNNENNTNTQFNIDLLKLEQLYSRLANIVTENRQKLRLIATNQNLASVSKL